MKKNQVLKNLTGAIIPAALFALWILLSESGRFSPIIMPTIKEIGNSLIESITNGTIALDLKVSFLIVIRGYAIGATAGLLLGTVMGISGTVNRLFAPMFNAVRQIPPLAWIPLLILWVGIGDMAKIILISVGVFFPVLLNTISGISEVSTSYLEFARNYKIKKKDILLKILIPGAAPTIFVGLRLGAGTAWMSIVAAEMIAAVAGVGYRINAARNLLQTSQVIVYMVLIGVIGGLMDTLIRKIGGLAVKWREP